jgi:hypothetical protein
MDKTEVRSAASESGFSETYSSPVPSPMEPTGTSGSSNTLQSYLQSWRDEEEDSTITLQVNGEQVKCTALRIISEEEVAKLLSSIDGTLAVEDPQMLSMPIIEMPGNVKPGDECHNWIQQHHGGEIILSAASSLTDISSEVLFSKDTTDEVRK